MTQKPSFKDVVANMQGYLTELENCEPLRMETDPERRALRKRLPASEGIYVLYEGEDAKYVGRSDQLADRLLAHGRPSSGSDSASFAFNIARSQFDGSLALSRKQLAQDAKFQRLFSGAKEQVTKMDVKVVEVRDPIEQTIFEVYAHMELETPFNSFENH